MPNGDVLYEDISSAPDANTRTSYPEGGSPKIIDYVGPGSAPMPRTYRDSAGSPYDHTPEDPNPSQSPEIGKTEFGRAQIEALGRVGTLGARVQEIYERMEDDPRAVEQWQKSLDAYTDTLQDYVTQDLKNPDHSAGDQINFIDGLYSRIMADKFSAMYYRRALQALALRRAMLLSAGQFVELGSPDDSGASTLNQRTDALLSQNDTEDMASFRKKVAASPMGERLHQELTDIVQLDNKLSDRLSVAVSVKRNFDKYQGNIDQAKAEDLRTGRTSEDMDGYELWTRLGDFHERDFAQKSLPEVLNEWHGYARQKMQGLMRVALNDINDPNIGPEDQLAYVKQGLEMWRQRPDRFGHKADLYAIMKLRMAVLADAVERKHREQSQQSSTV